MLSKPNHIAPDDFLETDKLYRVHREMQRAKDSQKHLYDLHATHYKATVIKQCAVVIKGPKH